jgi:glycosyltransferase involved in cell wall biosynthesis
MRRELEAEFAVPSTKITVIPFGINDAVPTTSLTTEQARASLGLDLSHKVLLFFGNIAPYKGLEYLVRAVALVAQSCPECRLVIAGRVKSPLDYWSGIEREIAALGLDALVFRQVRFISEEQVEVYFKLADVLVLPYTEVYQSGVLFLGFQFGLPAIATDVGAMTEVIHEGENGILCRPRDPEALAEAIRRYFRSEMHRSLSSRREAIRSAIAQRHSWKTVGDITATVYRSLSREAQA